MLATPEQSKVLDPSQNVPFYRWPELNTEFDMPPHLCQVQGDNHCPGPAGLTIADTSQGAIGLLASWAYAGSCSTALRQHPQVLFCWENKGLLPLRPTWIPFFLFGFARQARQQKTTTNLTWKACMIRERFRESGAQMKMMSYLHSNPCKTAFKYDWNAVTFTLGIENKGHIPSECSYMGNFAG